jgi:hypothetical protein
MWHHIYYRSAFFTVILLFFSLAVVVSGQKRLSEQTPDQLCKCGGDDSARKGGIVTYEAFQKKYGSRFKSGAEGQLAWKVYQAANRCDAVMVIGRLADTEGFEGKPGYCVLRGLSNWSVAINDVFIHGGTDRQSRFMLVSQSPLEALGGIDARKVEADRETNWRVIYNHEISEVQNTERYQLIGSPDTFSPQKPGRFEHKICDDLSGNWGGTLIVHDIRGTSGIQPGQSRIANITIEQSGCRVRLKFATNEIAGYLRPSTGPPLLEGVLDENIAGALVRAEIIKPPSGPLDLTIEQQSQSATIISTGKLTRK